MRVRRSPQRFKKASHRYLFWRLAFAFLLALIVYVVVVPNPV
jgi:hypothetical protein